MGVVAVFNNIVAAKGAVALLEGHGITAEALDTQLATIDWTVQTAIGIRIVVPDDQESEARAILEAAPSPAPDDDGEPADTPSEASARRAYICGILGFFFPPLLLLIPANVFQAVRLGGLSPQSTRHLSTAVVIGLVSSGLWAWIIYKLVLVYNLHPG